MASKHKTFDISCGKCGAYLLTYHKFGAGKGILRLYLGNIAAPKKWANIGADCSKVQEVPHLCCDSCNEVLGTAIERNNGRWAYRMRQGYFHRKLKR